MVTERKLRFETRRKRKYQCYIAIFAILSANFLSYNPILSSISKRKMMLRSQSLTASASVSNHRCAFRIKRDALCNTVRRRRICKWRRGSLEREEEEAIEVEVEIDRAKAREALKQLDQQLQSLSESQPQSQPQPQPQPPLSTKTKPSNTPEMDSDLNRDFFMRRDGREEMPEISDSYLAYTAGALVLLTILNNIVFSFFIKPSIDGYQKPIVLERVPLSEPD